MKTILLIGSTGYIGKSLKKILKEDYKLICPLRKSGFDITNYKKLEKLFKKNIDIVINLSGQNSSITNMKKTIIKGNQNIIKILKNKKKPIIYYISTTLVYGYSSKFVSETSMAKPISNYAKFKYKGENLLKRSSLNYKILRLSNVYSIKKNNFINNLLKSKKKSQKFFVNNLNSYRNYIHLDDVVTIINKILHLNLKHKIYNIGHENFTTRQIIEKISKKINIKLKYLDKKINIRLDSSQKLKKCKLYNEIKLYPKLSFNKFLDKN